MDWARLKGMNEADEQPRRRLVNPDRQPGALVADNAAQLTGEAILHLQRAAGNGSVTELLARRLAIQRQPAEAATTQEKEAPPARSPSPSTEFGWADVFGAGEKAAAKQTPFTSPAVSMAQHLFDSQVVWNIHLAHTQLLMIAKLPRQTHELLTAAQDELADAREALDQLIASHSDPDVKAELQVANDEIFRAVVLLGEHIEKQLVPVEVIRQEFDANNEPLRPRLNALRGAIFTASDPVVSVLRGQGEAVKALMDFFERQVVDKVQDTYLALEPPHPDLELALRAVRVADSALNTLANDAHDAAFLARVELVRGLVNDNMHLLLEHGEFGITPVDLIATLIDPTFSRLKTARAALAS